MKPSIITFQNLTLKATDKDHLQPLNGQLCAGENVVLSAHQHPELLFCMAECLQAKQIPFTGQILVASEQHYKMLFLAWLAPVVNSKYFFEHILNHGLSQNSTVDANKLFALLDELKWTQYLKLPLSALIPNLLTCVMFVLGVLVGPQVICLTAEQAQTIKAQDNCLPLLRFCQEQHISLLVLTNDSFWLAELDHCQEFKLDSTTQVAADQVDQFSPQLSSEDHQTWQLYHEIKKHLNTPEFQHSSPELQEKVLTIYDQYRQQLKQIDPALLNHIPDNTWSTTDWLQSQSQLTKMLLSESLNEEDLLQAVEQHPTSTFEPSEEDTQMFASQSANLKLSEAIQQSQPKTQTITMQTTQQSTVLIPPTDIDKIKKPKNQSLKELFHLKHKKGN